MIAARTRLFIVASSLVAFLAAAKGWYLIRHATPPEASLDYVRALAAVSYTDLIVVAIVWTALRVLVAIASQSQARLIVARFHVIAAVAVAYAMLNVAIFDSFGGYLTASLMGLLPRVAFVRAAAAERLDMRVFAIACGATAIYVAVVALAQAWAGRGGARHRVVVGATALLLTCAWVATGRQEYRSRWAGYQDHRASENAHWLLVQSTWQAMRQGLVIPREPVLDDDLRDFAPVAGNQVRPAAETASRPNVVLIVLESVAARWTGVSGGRYPTTPELVRDAAGGTTFDAAYAHVGRSSDALAAILLSHYPKLDFRDITDEYPRLPGTSLAALFHDRGYRTAYETSSDFAWASWRRFLEGRGFDQLVDYHGLTCTPPVSEWGVEDRCLVDALVEYVEANRGRPFFVMAWTTQTHYPYEPTPGLPLLDLAREPAGDVWDLNRYLNVLHETDRHLGRLFDALRTRDLDRRTLVVILGDHGQAFGYPHASYSQGRTAYEEDVHIPLVLRGPGVVEGGRSDAIAAQVDVAPTIAELAGLPGGPDWQGRSLFGADRLPRAYFFVAEDHFTLGVREGDWKYLWDLREGTEQLFDLHADPDEQRNLASDQRARAAALRQRLAAWLEANRRTYM